MTRKKQKKVSSRKQEKKEKKNDKVSHEQNLAPGVRPKHK
jgi:hypothetical protein